MIEYDIEESLACGDLSCFLIFAFYKNILCKLGLAVK